MVAEVSHNQQSLRIERTISISASINFTYQALLEQLGPSSEMHDGTPMPMKFEPWPGGRWFRDLGDNSGHWWGTVQVIKPPTLIEINGPMFMSYPALSHIQYRLVEDGDNTTLKFLHRAIGELEDRHIEGVQSGWDYQLNQIKSRAQQG